MEKKMENEIETGIESIVIVSESWAGREVSEDCGHDAAKPSSLNLT